MISVPVILPRHHKANAKTKIIIGLGEPPANCLQCIVYPDPGVTERDDMYKLRSPPNPPLSYPAQHWPNTPPST